MITNKDFGRAGRLGNQMFQYAVLLGIYAKKGYEIVFDNEIINIEIFNNFKIDVPYFLNKKDIFCLKTFQENSFHYDENFFNKINDGYNILGHFQSYKYFKHCYALVRDQFIFDQKILSKSKCFIDQIRNNKQIVSIHVRRTDYNDFPDHHPLCGLKYYKEAISKFNNKENLFIVVSDDINWCKENIVGDNIFYSKHDTFVDLCTMSLCDHNIIANSSFGWWGSWLNKNPNKIIVAPKKWFGTAYSHFNTKDIYLPKTIII